MPIILESAPIEYSVPLSDKIEIQNTSLLCCISFVPADKLIILYGTSQLSVAAYDDLSPGHNLHE
jgi:hypothetical protein